jgi:hypothetical protein
MPDEEHEPLIITPVAMLVQFNVASAPAFAVGMVLFMLITTLSEAEQPIKVLNTVKM